MDFGYSDDQRDIQRTARDLLTERARHERVRELAEADRSDDELWRELGELGWAGIAVPEEDGGQGLGSIELAILSEELGRSLAPVPFLPSVMAAALIEHGGSPAQRELWLPELASGAVRGAIAQAEGGADLVIGGAQADVLVLVDDEGTARLLSAEEADLTPIA